MEKINLRFCVVILTTLAFSTCYAAKTTTECNCDGQGCATNGKISWNIENGVLSFNDTGNALVNELRLISSLKEQNPGNWVWTKNFYKIIQTQDPASNFVHRLLSDSLSDFRIGRYMTIISNIGLAYFRADLNPNIDTDQKQDADRYEISIADPADYTSRDEDGRTYIRGGMSSFFKKTTTSKDNQQVVTRFELIDCKTTTF
jgi:hypothetical protein